MPTKLPAMNSNVSWRNEDKKFGGLEKRKKEESWDED